MNPSNTCNSASTTNADAIAQAERLQGERFLQLSQSCHEQNWAQVHALAEQIELHKQTIAQTQQATQNEKADARPAAEDGGRSDNVQLKGGDVVEQLEASDADGDQKQNINPAFRRASREGTVSISGEVMKIDTYTAPNKNGTVVNGSDAHNNEQGNEHELTLSNDDNSNTTNNSGEVSTMNHNQVTTTQVQVILPAVPRSTPRLLSTCLGTASPLAWTCRYSAPSTTVKLVLDLDLSAVRRCLPQLGTPLHECVGRPRPLRKMPLKRGRWSNLIGNNTQASTTASSAAASATAAPTTPVSKPCKKNKSSSKIRLAYT